MAQQREKSSNQCCGVWTAQTDLPCQDTTCNSVHHFYLLFYERHSKAPLAQKKKMKNRPAGDKTGVRGTNNVSKWLNRTEMTCFCVQWIYPPCLKESLISPLLSTVLSLEDWVSEEWRRRKTREEEWNNTWRGKNHRHSETFKTTRVALTSRLPQNSPQCLSATAGDAGGKLVLFLLQERSEVIQRPVSSEKRWKKKKKKKKKFNSNVIVGAARA